MAPDPGTVPLSSSVKMRLITSLHLREEPDGSAVVIDDRTLTAAHLNKAATILLEALRQPRTRSELAVALADAANCAVDEAVPHVSRLVGDIEQLGWIELLSATV